jgi:hypothetical protein
VSNHDYSKCPVCLSTMVAGELEDCAQYCPSCDAAWHEQECAGCGQKIWVDPRRHRGSHSCEPNREAKVEAIRTGYDDSGRERNPGLGERLNDGFRLLDVNGE